MKIKLILYFLVLISLVACNEKKNEIDPNLLLSVALLQLPDRAENYDRDVQIITHTRYTADCDINYSDEDVNFVVERLKRGIARYPRGYWIKAGVEKIILCRYLTLNGRNVGGFSAPDGIYISVGDGERFFGAYSGGSVVTFFDGLTVPYSDLRDSTIHHELTHSIDRSQGLTFYSDPDWEGLNYPGFQYGNHNIPQNTSSLHHLPGFTSLYGTTNHLEDKATIGSDVMGSQFFYNRLVQACQTDPFVAAKVRKTVSRWKQFWPFAGAENTEWKIRITQAERDCG
ncbi:hypothetical protein Q4554_08240 [Leptospira santarosai]|uniref:LIC13305 family lipoprotein n=1 Tax=Leptospira santarosai TaxID=28183 RepID=UPI0026E3F7A4|nr:hypothetical protein [Leptospira santarosai]MDO6394078.1 hypothetical protein [Leptospira santarosai]